jgi:hypothetical protein
MTLKAGGAAVATALLLSAPAGAQTVELEVLATALATEGAVSGGAATSPDVAPLPAELRAYLMQEAHEWTLRPGDTLRDALERWADKAGYKLIWNTQRDYPIEAGVTFPVGTSFLEASRQVMRAAWRSNPGIKATVYANHVIVVTDATGGTP